MRSAHESRNPARIECRLRGALAPSFVGRRARAAAFDICSDPAMQ
jgi:hypothetical protein